jgi:ABC-2 type transport system permease protein
MTGALAVRRDHSAASPSAGRIMQACIRAEWTKLRTVRSTIWAMILTVISIIGFGTLITALELTRWDQRSTAEVIGFDPLLYSLVGLNLAQLSVGVLGVLVMTTEYATGAITLTFGATPQRRTVLVSKVVTFSAIVAIVAVLSSFVVFGICQALLASRHAGVSIGDRGVFRAVLGGALHLVLVGAIAVTLGALVRRTAGAIAILFAVLLVIPGLVTLLPSPWNDDVTKYLPNAAGVAMSAVVRFPDLLSPLGGLIVLCGYTIAALAAAMTVLSRRDA